MKMEKTKKKILVVEDDDQVLQAITFFLEWSGYLVDTAKNGLEAMDKLLKCPDNLGPFDLLMTDIFMPEMNGLELIDEIKKKEIDVPIIVFTGGDNREMTDNLRLRGFTDFITKPFEQQKLLEHISRTFEKQGNA